MLSFYADTWDLLQEHQLFDKNPKWVFIVLGLHYFAAVLLKSFQSS